MSGRQNVMVGADDGFYYGTLPFPVPFWGAWHQEWVVTSNGQVSFGSLFTGSMPMPSQAPFNSSVRYPSPPSCLSVACGLHVRLRRRPDPW